MGDWCQGILGLDSGGSDDERVSAEEEEKWGRKAVMFDPPETPRATCRLSLPVNTNKMGSADKLCYRDERYLFRHTEIRVDFVFWWILSKQTNQIQFSALRSCIHCKHTVCGVPTCDEGVLDAETKAFQLLVADELDPHEPSRWCDQARVLSPTEAVNEWREPKWPITDFNVIEAALKWWLDVIVLIKSQLNPLSGERCGEQGSGGQKQKGLIHEKNKIKSSCFRTTEIWVAF